MLPIYLPPITLTVVPPCHNWLRFHIPPDTKSFHRHSSQPISRLSTEKLKQIRQKQTCIRNKIYYNIKWTQKTTARFGRLLWSLAVKRKGPILSWFWHFIIVTYLDTYLQPRAHHAKKNLYSADNAIFIPMTFRWLNWQKCTAMHKPSKFNYAHLHNEMN